MNRIPILDPKTFADWSSQLRRPFHHKYFAMYSSVFGGIVTDPVLMLAPFDDHLVHRGDGVFETLKYVQSGIYNLAAHLKRLRHSAGQIGITYPWSETELTEIVVQTVRAGVKRDGSLRIIVSRGPGSLTVNPYDSPRPELYVMAYAPSPSFMESHPGGARVKLSAVPIKPSFFANIKSCNYLPNVLMKKEAVDAGLDFTVSVDESGLLAEGATENVGIVTAERVLRFPPSRHILPGTTMERVIALAKGLVEEGTIRAVERGDVAPASIQYAREMLIAGTSPDVTAVVEFDGRPVGDGKAGPVYKGLSSLLKADILENSELRTHF